MTGAEILTIFEQVGDDAEIKLYLSGLYSKDRDDNDWTFHGMVQSEDLAYELLDDRKSRIDEEVNDFAMSKRYADICDAMPEGYLD